MKAGLILTGGFLGSGKTTLLKKTAELLQGEKKTGVITNDQTDQLVDTIYMQTGISETKEVSGSCFCCNFPGFKAAIDSLIEEYQTEVILAEPVGSCTDLSATILQPLKKYYSDEIRLLPFTVLVDPERMEQLLSQKIEGMHESAAYILKKQLEEADIVLISKIDTLEKEEYARLLEQAKKAYPTKKVVGCSALTGEGVKEWLEVLKKDIRPGQTITEVDYDTYAEGEACLGWLNTTVSLSGEQIDWKSYLDTLLEKIFFRLKGKNQAIGHIKAMVQDGDFFVLGNLTGTSRKAILRGEMERSNQAVLTFNARAELGKEELTNLTKELLEQVSKEYQAKMEIKELNSLIPGRPNPTYRMKQVI